MAAAPASDPRGMADQARTWATLTTRPYSWGGTIAWRRAMVLMLSSKPKPEDAAHSTSAPGYESARAMAVMVNPATTRAPRAATAKETRRRIGPAMRLTATTPAAPAAYRKPISELVARRACRAKRTSWELAVEATKLIRAIMIEMERSTGLDHTYARP